MTDLPGVQDSLWMATSGSADRPPVTGDGGHYDVAVVGAGITGLTTALRLKQAGLRVAVLEMGVVGQGVTGFTTAKVTSLHGLKYADLLDHLGEDRARAYGEANEAAVAHIAATVTQLELDCAFERRPAVTWTADPERADAVRREAEVARSLGLPAAFTDEVDLPFPIAGAVRFDEQAQFHPRDYVLGLAAAVGGDGSLLAERSRVHDVSDGEPCQLSLEDGTLTADHVVLATHLPFLDRGGFFAKAHPTRSYALAAVVDGPLPQSMSINVESPTRSVRPYSRGGESYLIVSGGGGHRPGDHEEEREEWAALAEWAQAHFPIERIAYRWSAQDYSTLDGMPYVGRLSRTTARLWTATGFDKWGMTNGTAAGIILADGILGRENAWADAFDANRSTPVASARELVTENVEVAKHFVGDRLDLPGEEAVGGLEDGAGAVIRVDGQPYAVCRLADRLLSVSPVCTHLGCHVRWNSAEQSWDCPCHGSRYSPDGRVIHGPAVRDLDPKPLPGDIPGR